MTKSLDFKVPRVNPLKVVFCLELRTRGLPGVLVCVCASASTCVCVCDYLVVLEAPWHTISNDPQSSINNDMKQHDATHCHIMTQTLHGTAIICRPLHPSNQPQLIWQSYGSPMCRVWD